MNSDVFVVRENKFQCVCIYGGKVGYFFLLLMIAELNIVGMSLV